MSQAGLVDVESSHPQIPTEFVTDDGIAVPIANVLEILASAVPAQNIPIQTTGSGNTVTIQSQYASANATSDPTEAGVASFNSADFTVDADGFVSLTGGGSFDQLTPDVGGPVLAVAGNINVFGVQANTTPVMITENITSDFYIENRTWETQYVVDGSSTVGLRGTFTTIQDAVDQVDADGSGTAVYRPIIIRSGTYVEDVVIPSGVNIQFIGSGSVVINGNMTFGVAGSLVANDVFFVSGGGNAIDLTNSINCSFENCNIFSVLGSSGANYDTCDISAGTFTANGSVFNESVISATFSGGTSIFNRSTIDTIIVSNNANLQLNYCIFRTSPITHTGTFTGNITVNNAIQVQQAIFGVNGGTLNYSNITISEDSTNNYIINPSSTPTTVNAAPSSGGNIKYSRRTAISTSLTRYDMYLGVTDTSAPRTITLANSPSGSVPFIDQVFTVKDESGGAASNNITVVNANGLIDGAASFVMNTNYGSISFIFDGTDCFII